MSDNGQTSTEADERTSPETAFRQENITLREHIDPDKHWIGEALPAASDKEARPVSTVLTSAGKSIFPARADHIHDTSQYWGVYTSGGQSIAQGQVFVSGLAPAGGKDMRAPASTQIIQFPVPGCWQIVLNLHITGSCVNQLNVVYFYFNGSASRTVYRNDVSGFGSVIDLAVIDYVHIANIDATSNVQFAIQHNNGGTYTSSTTMLDVRRMGAYTSA